MGAAAPEDPRPQPGSLTSEGMQASLIRGQSLSPPHCPFRLKVRSQGQAKSRLHAHLRLIKGLLYKTGPVAEGLHSGSSGSGLFPARGLQGTGRRSCLDLGTKVAVWKGQLTGMVTSGGGAWGLAPPAPPFTPSMLLGSSRLQATQMSGSL